jgi:hypothetical protein
MKSTFLFSAIVVVMSIGQLNAQDSLQLKSFIGRKFENDFFGATEVEWSRAPSHYVVLFKIDGEVWLAFYSEHGELLASGRRLINIRALPLYVQLGVAETKRQLERKSGMVITTNFAIETVAADSARPTVLMKERPAALMICSAVKEDDGTQTRTVPISPSIRFSAVQARSN